MRKNLFDQQKVLRESPIKTSHLRRDLEFVSARAGKTRTRLACFTERKKGTLLFKGKTDSVVQRNTTEGENASLCSCQGPQDHEKGRRHRWAGNKEECQR